MKIIFLSHTPRDSIFKVGNIHLSREYARMNHEVLYIPSAVSPFHLLNIPALRDKNYRNTLKNRIQSFSVQRDEEGVLNLTPFIFIPFNRHLFDNHTIVLRRKFTFNRIGKKLKKIGFNEPDLLIQDRPGLFFLRHYLNAKTWIYRATDDYSTMSGGPSRTSIQKLEGKICQFADQVVVTSEPLKQLFRERYNVEAAVVRNGVDTEHFTKPQPIPAEYQSLNKPIMVYVGSFDNRFDSDLLLKTADKNTAYNYVLIGPESKALTSPDRPNIIALGPKPYQQVPAYMQHADIGMLPLKLTPANHARSPMKMYEYGICGLPVVSTPLEELQARREDFVTFADTPERFCSQIGQSLDQKNRIASIAIDRSKTHSWNKIAREILALADSPEMIR